MAETQKQFHSPGHFAALGFLAGYGSLILTPPVGEVPAWLGVLLLKLFDHGMMLGLVWGSWKCFLKGKNSQASFFAGAALFWAGMNLWDLALWITGNFR